MSASQLGNIKGVLFDMDGLLIDSENVYTIVINNALRPYGKEQTWEVKSKIMGMPEKKATETLLANLWPPTAEEHAQGCIFSSDCPFTVESFLRDRNMSLDDYFRKVKPLPGAQRLISHLEKHSVPFCLATGSQRYNYEIKSSNNQDLFRPFGDRIICGDDPRLSRGKPNPDVFLLAARDALGFQDGIREPGPEHDGKFGGEEASLLVFEDGRPGVQAAQAAGMSVVWVPDPNLSAILQRDGVEMNATQTLSSLEHFRPEQWGLPPFDE